MPLKRKIPKDKEILAKIHAILSNPSSDGHEVTGRLFALVHRVARAAYFDGRQDVYEELRSLRSKSKKNIPLLQRRPE
jgi:hypothetical protein